MGKVQLINSIFRTAFRCRTCGKVYIAGVLGMDTLIKRVSRHFHDTGHMDIPPINPRVGMYYVHINTNEQVGVPFDGIDSDKWLKEIRTLGREVGGIKPAWDLKEV